MKTFQASPAAAVEANDSSNELTCVKYKNTDSVVTITDKLANIFFSLNAPPAMMSEEGKPEMIPLKYEGNKSKKEITLLYTYSFNEDAMHRYGLSKQFNAFDFFVMIACDNLFRAGNTRVSLTKIYKELGSKTSPNCEQLEPICKSLLKGSSTQIIIDHKDVLKAWKKDPYTTHKKIVSPVMPVHLNDKPFKVGGEISKTEVHLNGISPFLQVAESINHITAWNKDIFSMYSGRKTIRYYSVLLFLMTQIGWIRHKKGERNNKILYASLYQYAGETTPSMQKNARDMMDRLLHEVFIPMGYIKSCKKTSTPNLGIELRLK